MLRRLLTTFFTALFSDQILIFINNIQNVDNNILTLNLFSEVLLFGNFSFNNTKNTSILNTTIEYIVSSKRFEVLLIFMHGCFIYLLLFSLLFKFSFSHCAIVYLHWLSICTFLSCNSCTWFLVQWLFFILSVWKYMFSKSNKVCPNCLNWSSCTKLALSASWTHGLIAQSVRASEFSGRGFKSHSGQLSIATSKNLSVVNTIYR